MHLRGHENIKTRYLLHVAAFNLSLVTRKLIGAGTPRGLASRAAQLAACVDAAATIVGVLAMRVEWIAAPANAVNGRWRRRFSTGC